MRNTLSKTISFLRYLKHAKYRHGFSVHSPFAYQLITEVFEEETPYYIYKVLEERRKTLRKDKTLIDVTDYGTRPSGQRSISEIAKRSIQSKRYAQLLFRIANHFQPETVIELGTSLGITTAYLAKGTPKGQVHSLEGSSNLIKISKETAKIAKASNVTFHEGNIDDILKKTLNPLKQVDFAFLDANHTGEATLRYFNILKEKATSYSVFVIDDIHASEDMEEAWNQIVKEKKVRVTFDFFTMGILFFNEELQKQDYIYNF